MNIAKIEDRKKVIEDIKHLQMMVTHILRPPTTEVWMELNLSIAQLKTLMYLHREGSTSLSKLAGALGVTPPNVTGIVERLVEQGLVSREENPENRRQLILRLTDESRMLMNRLWENSDVRMNKILSNMTAEDLLTWNKGLKAVIAAAEKGGLGDNRTSEVPEGE